ncbi:phosphotransferase enzyme family protein [Grimontia marina]|uniref:Phosphotransferase enzyme family protein n=1 Tax=Grimontia marina TaxID=646534 RepID=A0A128FJY2_9GAMM|nr:aminoglycoside phosphotransferase family protein [Grimontia marina]CZF86880.1 Phosphotransferase enzyme family protein [Grimontia marina]
MEKLPGGRAGIYRANNHVIRPANKTTPLLHRLLNHLHQQGFHHCPKPIAIDSEHERLSFLEGQVYNYPLQGHIASKRALISAARLLRQMHDASVSFVDGLDGNENWILPVRVPTEVICHGDFAPYNLVLNGEEAVGIIDFDTAHPAPRTWDLAYALYCWAPFKTHAFDKLGSLNEQIDRAGMFCEAYGVTKDTLCVLPDVMIDRLEVLVSFMKSEADKGNEAFQKNLDDGHHLAYEKDIQYISQNKQKILTYFS